MANRGILGRFFAAAGLFCSEEIILRRFVRAELKIRLTESGESLGFIPTLLELFPGKPDNLGFRREE
jgi:hypothetical protein